MTEDEYVIIRRSPGMTITLSWEPDPNDMVPKKCEEYPNCEECGDYPAPCNCDDPTTHGGH